MACAQKKKFFFNCPRELKVTIYGHKMVIKSQEVKNLTTKIGYDPPRKGLLVDMYEIRASIIIVI